MFAILSLLFVFTVAVIPGCTTENLASGSAELTPREEARQALEEEDWDKAVSLYSELIASEPDSFELYPLLAAAYAGRGGIDILTIIESVINSDGAGNNLLGSIGEHVPKEPSVAQLADVRAAIEQIESMPLDHRAKDGSYSYSSETNTQLTIYLGAESSMIVNKYTPDEEFDEEVTADDLENMTDDEVDAMISNIDTIAQTGDESLAAAAEDVLTAIEATEGETQKEKLINYIAAAENEPSAPESVEDLGSDSSP